MNRTYSDLKRGGVLAVGDTLLLHGYEHDVRKGSAETYWLNNSSLANCAVFEKFDKDKYDWARKFGSTCSGDFPEFRSLQELTKFVISIYEEPEFKKGDYVTINERELTATDYPASFVDDMVKLSGKTFLVDGFSITEADEERKAYNGDPHWYYLRTPSYGIWTWHSSMFRKATREEILASQGAKGDFGAKCDSGSASDSITVDADDASKLTSIREEIKSWEEILGGNTDCALRLPKNTNKTPHINL
jgi:hypothetical protein